MKQFPVICLAVLAAGCVTVRRTSPATPDYQAAKAFSPILVIPPMAASDRCSDAARDGFAQALAIELANATESRCVLAGDITELQPMLTRENLVVGGHLNLDELRVMGKTSRCNSVVATLIVAARPYRPQSMVVKHVWLDANDGEMINTVLANLDLADAGVRDRYREFIGEDLVTRATLPLKEVHAQDRFHMALLSPAQFRRFVAADSLRRLFRNE